MSVPLLQVIYSLLKDADDGGTSHTAQPQYY